ncbi:MAG: DivIVA domain-containing protein [Clostridiales bacterium]|nr:DivIVA domain-containing protein [Clostridiales bacterium]
MLTPIELQGTTLKSGIGYNKKETDQFLESVYRNYEELYKENLELKDKIENLNEAIQHYKGMEKTLQKALVLAEQTSSDMTDAAKKKAAMIEKDAKGRAQIILHDAKVECNRIQDQIRNLVQQYDKYRTQYKQLAASQLELLESEGYQIKVSSFDLDEPESDLIADSDDDYGYFQKSVEKTSEEALETYNKVETLSAETKVFEKINSSQPDTTPTSIYYEMAKREEEKEKVPEITVQPAPEPEPAQTVTAVPEPEPVSVSEPVQVPEPVSVPEPVQVSKPAQVPEPSPVPDPVQVPEPSPVPDPAYSYVAAAVEEKKIEEEKKPEVSNQTPEYHVTDVKEVAPVVMEPTVSVEVKEITPSSLDAQSKFSETISALPNLDDEDEFEFLS